MLLLDLFNENDDKIDPNLFSCFENEFGRTLSPMEYEIINGWVNEKFSNEIFNYWERTCLVTDTAS